MQVRTAVTVETCSLASKKSALEKPGADYAFVNVFFSSFYFQQITQINKLKKLISLDQFISKEKMVRFLIMGNT